LISRVMLKNILGGSIYQLVVIFGLLFVGPEMMDIDDGSHDRDPTPHLTMIFNTFVMMTLFNEINARKLHGQRNVFKGFFSNPMFYGIWVVTFVVQVLIVWFGGRLFFVAILTPEQWLWCVCFGVGTLLWFQIVTAFPTRWVPNILEMKCRRKKKTESGRKSDYQHFGEHDPDHDIIWSAGVNPVETKNGGATTSKATPSKPNTTPATPKAPSVQTIPSKTQTQQSSKTQMKV